MPKTSGLTRTLAAVGAGALVFHAIRWVAAALGPTQSYRMEQGDQPCCDSVDFVDRLACVSDSIVYRDCSITVLPNGPVFYPAEFAAIDAATQSINLQAYEFLPGDLTQELVRRLTARARAGVAVRVLIDYAGSFSLNRSFFAGLLAAGGSFAWFHPLDLAQWANFNHRSHRKLLTVDGRTGFIGGADYADHWIESEGTRLPWRDTVFKLEGSIVRSLNSAFPQNWVDATSEILFNNTQFAAPQISGAAGLPESNEPGKKIAMLVIGRPGRGVSSVRVLFQALIDAATISLQITSPYFLPDHSARHALMRAVRRGVRVQIITAGRFTDHVVVRRFFEATSLHLLRAGIELYEYQPAMIHAKLMTVDGAWCVGGSSNFDPRSFVLNDEVALAIYDREIVATLETQFAQDLARSQPITPAYLSQLSLGSRILAETGWLLRSEE
jgi:cardiolipin synthase